MSDNATQCNSPWERVPTCGCDMGIGAAPTKQQRLECRMRGGPCSPRHVATVDEQAILDQQETPTAMRKPTNIQRKVLSVLSDEPLTGEQIGRAAELPPHRGLANALIVLCKYGWVASPITCPLTYTITPNGRDALNLI